jgi:CubicO group peptidase (beta-lactamase class C family)
MNQYARLEAVLEEIIFRWGLPGLVVGIVRDGDIEYEREFGVQSLESGIPMTLKTIFCVQSISKCFVAAAIMQLVEQGKLNLDAPIVEYLPYFRLDDDRFRQITTRLVLSHTSGMPDIDEMEYDEMIRRPEDDDGSAERFVRSLGARKMIAAPGERFWYSNIGYDVLGDLISKVSGQLFESYMRDHVLGPSGMQNSTFLLSEVERERLALPHLRSPSMVVSPHYPYHRADAPSSWLHSNLTEMCHWIITCLGKGAYRDRRILDPSSCDFMWAPVVKRRSEFYQYGASGWITGAYEGQKVVSHGGGGFGWTGFLSMFPEKNAGFILLVNEESTARERLIHAVARAVIGLEPQPGTVSWMVPVGKAIQEGGIEAAYRWYERSCKDGSQEYVLEEYDLVSLVYQLMGLEKLDLAVDVLKLNIHAFPGSLLSYLFLARLYLNQGDPAKVIETAKKVLAIQPDNPEMLEILQRVNDNQ